MKPLTTEWTEKAESDFSTMERESRARKNPNYDGVCFHAQQCAEKYLKAHMVEANISVPRSHDLLFLLEKLLPVQPMFAFFREDLAYLSDFSVMFRYPGESAEKETAREGRKRCRRFRTAAREAFGIK